MDAHVKTMQCLKTQAGARAAAALIIAARGVKGIVASRFESEYGVEYWDAAAGLLSSACWECGSGNRDAAGLPMRNSRRDSLRAACHASWLPTQPLRRERGERAAAWLGSADDTFSRTAARAH